MATADSMARKAAAERKAKNARIASTRARNRRVRETSASYGGARMTTDSSGVRTTPKMTKYATKRTITTPKRGSQTTRTISNDRMNKSESRAFNRYTKSAFTGTSKKARAAEGPKRSMPRKKK